MKEYLPDASSEYSLTTSCNFSKLISDPITPTNLLSSTKGTNIEVTGFLEEAE